MKKRLQNGPRVLSKSFKIEDLGKEIGYGLEKGETTLSPRYGALVVLKKIYGGELEPRKSAQDYN